MKEQELRTNVTRLLTQKKVDFRLHAYETESAVSGVEAAERIGVEKDRVFKTLVTVGKSGLNYVFLVPVAQELELRKAAAAVGEKKLDMLKAKELLPLTGYVHGGCSPIGMKKLFPTVVDETAQLFDRIVFSAGKIGCHVELSPAALEALIPLKYADICE